MHRICTETCTYKTKVGQSSFSADARVTSARRNAWYFALYRDIRLGDWRCSPLVVNLFSEYFLRYAGQSVDDAFGHYEVVGGSVRPTKLLAVKFS